VTVLERLPAQDALVVGAGAPHAATIAARIERLPFSAWHIRLVSVVGLAHLLDAFDSLAIALVAPVLLEIWHLTAIQLGQVISVGYVGQLVGAIGLSWLAERFGRLRMLRLALGIMATLSVATAFAGNYMAFMVLRLIQGFGLGGEVPIAATLVNETTPGRFRGRAICRPTDRTCKSGNQGDGGDRTASVAPVESGENRGRRGEDESASRFIARVTVDAPETGDLIIAWPSRL
jgi:Major Facilitator Superfamily